MENSEILGLVYLLGIFMGFGVIMGAYLARSLDDLYNAIERAKNIRD